MELTLNCEKTQITKLKEGFEFLGFLFVKRKSRTKGKNAIYIFPTKRSQQKVRDKLRSLTSRKAPITPEVFIKQIKPIMMGWVNYYRHTNAIKAFRGLQDFVNKRFRRYLTYTKKSRGFGWKRYPNRKLYAMGMPQINKSLTR
jgi:RNA-directed DNA polymerase